MTEDNETEQDVGYKNPPEHSQFEEGNDGALKHGLFQEESNMYQSMSDEEKKILGAMSKELVWKYQEVHGEDPTTVEREMIRNLVLDTIKRRRANEYMFEADEIDFENQSQQSAYSRIRRDNQDELESLGLLDTPEAKKQEAEASWFDVMSEAEEQPE